MGPTEPTLLFCGGPSVGPTRTTIDATPHRSCPTHFSPNCPLLVHAAPSAEILTTDGGVTPKVGATPYCAACLAARRGSLPPCSLSNITPDERKDSSTSMIKACLNRVRMVRRSP